MQQPLKLDECSMSSRDFYLKVALGSVRSVELELVKFITSLSITGYNSVMSVLEENDEGTIVRNTIGRIPLRAEMTDFDNVILPRLKSAVLKWKRHCVPFKTDGLVTERTVLEQWVEESISYIACCAMRMIDAVGEDPVNFYVGRFVPATIMKSFPKIYAWQTHHER